MQRTADNSHMARRGLAIIFTLLGLAVFVSLIGLAAMYFVIGRAPSVPSNAVLNLSLGGDLAEVAPTDVVAYVRGGRTPTVRSIVDDLRKAKVDGRISAVMLRLTGFSTPYWGKLQEIRDALIDFRTSKKPVYAYLEYGGDRDYYVATAADKVFLMPTSPLDLAGMATYEVFLRGLLDKFGVYPDLHHIGEYKTFSNTFTEKGFTPAHREMDTSMNRDLYDQVVRGVASARGKSEADVHALIDQGPFLPKAAKEAGLIDDLAYQDQVLGKLRESRPGATREIDDDDYSRISLSSLGLNRGPKIAVIYFAGAIASGKNGYDPLEGATIGSDTLIDYIRKVRKDSSVRAIILRIDSPGGSAAASDAIWRELMLAKKEKPNRPIVASMSDLGASGGYYIAAPAEAIVAQPATLTGSIGIVGGKFVTGGIYEKLGANLDAISIGKNAEMNSPIRAYNPEELKKVNEQLKAFYDDFVAKVADSRHKTWQEVDRLGQGRVWTGQQAKAIGLVDALGGLDRAVSVAKERAKIPGDSDVELVAYPSPKTFYELLSDQISGNSDSARIGDWLKTNLSGAEVDVLRAARGPAALFKRGEPLALMPVQYLR
jgi:protease IV